jgi:hypothetical protein
LDPAYLRPHPIARPVRRQNGHAIAFAVGPFGNTGGIADGERLANRLVRAGGVKLSCSE